MKDKNLTPLQVAFLSGAVLSLSLFLTLFPLSLFLPHIISKHAAVVVPVLTFALAVPLFAFGLERFLYRKIKLIYKTISELKMPKGKKRKERISLRENVLQNVEQEVLHWAERRNKEVEELRKLESYRREFLGNVSHELKTPLFNIQGYLETLLDGGLEDREVNRYYVEKALKNVDRLSAIVRDLEMIASLESGSLQLELEKFEICSLVDEVLESLDMKAKEMGITLRKKAGCNGPFYVIADKEKIRQVLVNLLDNSIKYGRNNGETVVGCYDMDTLVLVEVSDNGIGIPQEHLPRIFERFYRVDKSRSREKGGTGLGLAIVKHIIEAHNQTIHVRSSVGVGTTFGFTLQKAS